MNDEDFNAFNGIWWPYAEQKQKEMEQLFGVICECGTWVAMGKEYPDELHSDYCPVYIKWKQDYGNKAKS